MKYGNVYKAILERPWAILPSMLNLIVEIVDFRANGGHWTDEEVKARIEAVKRGPRDQKSSPKGSTVGIVPIYGVISPRAELFSESSGGTSVESLTSAFRAALNDDDIGSILFDIDSPGGNVEGIDELAQEIREARGIKPMASMARYAMASAAYYLGSQADEVIVTPSGQVGSIGIIYAHQDLSGALEKEGVKTTLVTHGKFKAEGNKFEPLSDEAKAEIQSHVDYYGGMFERAVAAGRGVPLDAVRDNFGAGRMFHAKSAVKAGLADRIETFEDTIARMARSAPSAASHSASAMAATDSFTWTPVQANTSNIEATAVARLPFAERLIRVADEVEAVAKHARERAAMRAEEDRELSSETRVQLARLLALRSVLDEIEALSAEPVKPRAVGRSLDLLMVAYEKGYDVTDLVEGLTE